MYTVTMLTLLALGAPVIKDKPKEPPKKEFSIVGNWKPSVRESNGKESKAEGPESQMKMMFTTDNRIVVDIPAVALPPAAVPQWTYHVNTSVDPHQITLTLQLAGKNKAIKGLVKIQDKKLIIITENEGNEFPKNFEIKGTKCDKITLELIEEPKPEKK